MPVFIVSKGILGALKRRLNQSFSLTDAVSFAVMAERGIKEALALDHHFSAAGFLTVP
jgi:predicted nucleic acid-binding protein